jgi:hypothetical protein
MEITSNIPFVVGNILAKFRELDNPETISRAAAVAVLPEFRNRIHVEGKKSDGSAIGTYSNSYLKLRQTPRYNRTSDPEVVASLTRQLENNYITDATENAYTIKNISEGNDKKIKHLTEQYGEIFLLTQGEKDLTQLVAQNTAIALMNA